jgi:hypothetical protein
LKWGAVMTEFSTVQIIPPSSTGGARTAGSRAGSGEVRDLVVANSGDAGEFVRRPLFAHAGNVMAGARPMVSAPFLAQHLGQELIHRDSPADSRSAVNSYVRAAQVAAPRHDLAPLT